MVEASMKFSATKRIRRGASIVEVLLIVVVVMAVTALAWKIGKETIHSADRSKVIAEITKFNEAFDNFCLRFGELPPDFHDQTATLNFLKRRFPKCPPKNYPDLSCQSPASALYFWLAGPKGLGFSTNPLNPFETKGTARIGPFFKFDKDRVHEVDDAMQYFPIRREEGGEPYVYFRGGPKGYDRHPGWNSAMPYRNSNTGKWINPDTFQLLCAGCDGKFGSGRLYPRGSDYDEYNYDDLANFTDGNTMRQSMVQYEKEQLDKMENAGKIKKTPTIANGQKTAGKTTPAKRVSER
jgi:hypothetical protein